MLGGIEFFAVGGVKGALNFPVVVLTPCHIVKCANNVKQNKQNPNGAI